MGPLIHDRDGRDWLFATASNPPVEDIARSLEHGGPISELSARRWALESSLFEDAATQFPLPDYFGHNWDALDECVFTESCNGRLIVIRDASAPEEANLGRFIDLFQFVWIPAPLARDWYASLFDGRVSPGRVTVVVTGREPEPIVASWSDGRERVYQPSPLLPLSQTK